MDKTCNLHLCAALEAEIKRAGVWFSLSLQEGGGGKQSWRRI